jgi:hypothetical protein
MRQARCWMRAVPACLVENNQLKELMISGRIDLGQRRKSDPVQPPRAQRGRDSAVLLRGTCGPRGIGYRWRARSRAAMMPPVKSLLRFSERILSGSLKRHQTGAWVATLAVLAAIAGTAWAQNPPDDKPAPQAPGAVRSSPLPAPVGHRQPRASDIPPPPPGDTSRSTEPRDDIDERLRICRGC